MSDRILILPFLAPSQDRESSAGRTWPLPGTGRETPPPARSVWTAIAAAWRRRRTRLALAQLDAHLLKDIGLTRAEAENEINKPFWRA